MTSLQRINQDLPDTFTRKDVLDTAKELGFSYSTANTFFEKAMYEGLIQRVDAGKYKKTAYA